MALSAVPAPIAPTSTTLAAMRVLGLSAILAGSRLALGPLKSAA